MQLAMVGTSNVKWNSVFLGLPGNPEMNRDDGFGFRNYLVKVCFHARERFCTITVTWEFPREADERLVQCPLSVKAD